MNHNTRLYVSFDSPHKGANIPMAGQQALYHLGMIVNQAAAKESYNNQIRSVAAKQMLIEQMDGLNKGSWFFNKYYTDLQNGGLANSQGWPMDLKKISLINGNANGINTNAAGAKILGLKANALAGVMRGLELDLFNMPNTGSSLTTYEGKVRGGGLFYLGTGTSVTNFIFNNNPNMWGWNTRSFVGLIYGITTDKATIGLSNQNSNGVMDIAPGGTYNTVEVLYRQIDKMLRDMSVIKKTSIEWKDLKFKHSFIPSVSALAFKNTNFNWSTPFNDRDLVCTQEIPFDAYYTAPGNEEHVSLTEASAKWALEEIEKGQPGCAPICKTGIQVGNDETSPLCLGNTRAFTHNYDLPSGVTVTWSIADNPYALDILWSNNYSVTVMGMEDYENAVIRYTISNPCGTNIEGSFTITVGVPMSGLKLYGISANTNGAKVQNFKPQTNSYSWGWNSSGWGNHNAEYYPGTFPTVSYYDPNAPELCLRTVNACGTDIECIYPYLPAAPLNAKLELKPTAFPNPANTYWNVTLPIGKTWQMSLYNSMGTLVWSKKRASVSEIIPAYHLAAGMYMLKIHTREESQTIKLIKQ